MTYLALAGRKWARTIVGPVLTVLGLVSEFTGRLDELDIGPYLLNVWFFGAVATFMFAQYDVWRDERTARSFAEASVLDDVSRRQAAPTKDEFDRWKAAKDKQNQGHRLSKAEREILARPEFGVTRSGILESLGRSLVLGRYNLDLIQWAGERFDKDWTALRESNPTEEEVRALLDGRLSDKAIEGSQPWQQDVGHALGKFLNYSFVAWFENDAGVTSAEPPPSLRDDWFVRAWRNQEIRLQRLQQIIEELHRKWG